ncbi:MAG: Secretion protein HlyD precursor [Tardiphaga sp.]|nr:Secretion protein HlyD precursor [Tardiphaga sp.]
MTRAIFGCTAAAVIAAAAAGLVVARWPASRVVLVAPAAAQSASAPIYYQDPDGKPDYSPTPRKTVDGRDYRPVYPETNAGAAGDAPAAMPMPASGTGGERKIKFYRNPMGLPDTSPVPKKDSMGMDYIPVYEGEDSDDGSVKLSPGKIQRTGVTSEPVARRVVRVAVKAPGTIQLDDRRVSVIAMRAESFVQKVADVTIGSRVKAGQPLMQIYSSAIVSAAAEYLATISSKIVGGNEGYGRGSRQRLTNLDVPEPVIAGMEKTRVAPVTVEWSAPRDGIVLERNAVEGMRANPGDVLFRIADISAVWALVDVAERDLGTVAVGQPVAIRARSFPGRIFSGKIAVIYPHVNRDTRTARVRIDLGNRDYALLPEMFVDAEIDAADAMPVLAVPESSILDTGSRQAVLIDKGEGRYEPRQVKLGRRGGGYVEVREGVADGDAVVTSANFLIDAESNLKAALKGFEGSPPGSQMPMGEGK